MKRVELPAYRAFMFAVVPQLYQAQMPNPTRIVKAIARAQELWDAIEAHVLEAAEKLKNVP